MPAWRRVTVLRQAPETQRPSAQVGGKTGRYCLCLLLARAILSAHAAARTTNGTIRGEPASPHNGRRVARPMELILDHIAPDLQLLPGDGVPEKALSGAPQARALEGDGNHYLAPCSGGASEYFILAHCISMRSPVWPSAPRDTAPTGDTYERSSSVRRSHRRMMLGGGPSVLHGIWGHHRPIVGQLCASVACCTARVGATSRAAVGRDSAHGTAACRG